MRLKFYPLFTVFVGLFPTFALPDWDDLHRAQTSAELIVVGTFASDPHDNRSMALYEVYDVELMVSEVLYGKPPETKKLHILIIRPKSTDDQMFRLKKGEQYVIFLKASSKANTPSWVTVDDAFCVEGYSKERADKIKKYMRKTKAA